MSSAAPLSIQRYLEAPAGPGADAALGELWGEVEPILREVIGAKFRVDLASPGAPRTADRLDAEDTLGEARSQLLHRLHAWREAGPGDNEPVSDLRGYAATVAFSAWTAFLRRKRPGRARLLDRLRWLLESNARQRGLARWDDPVTGQTLAGFSAWRDAAAPLASAKRVEALLADPAAFVRDFAPDAVASLESSPARLLAAIFDRVGGPLPLSALLDACAALWDWNEKRAAESAGPSWPEGRGVEELAAELPDPHDHLAWREYLAWLWRNAAELPGPARAAFLLHADVTKELVHHGIVSLAALATAVGFTPVAFAAEWDGVPWPDERIAAHLGLPTRQHVINLRRSARTTLGRGLATFLAEPAPARS